MPGKETCFIIMPITTPHSMMETYRDGKDHFQHVLECLFIPSIEKAGYAPKPPRARGSDLIHAEIVRSLESAPLVLCDLSCLNPNVFFEFGIRTSLNKPISVVKDDQTHNVPFDTGIINHLEYKSSLNPWDLSAQIQTLADHLRASAERSKGESTLWRYFGLKAEATPYQAESGMDAKLDYVTLQIDSLKKQLESSQETAESEALKADDPILVGFQILSVLKTMEPPRFKIQSYTPHGAGFKFFYKGELPTTWVNFAADTVRSRYGVPIEFEEVTDK